MFFSWEYLEYKMEQNYNLLKDQLVKSINDDSLVMFVGAGISSNSDLPTWKELIEAFCYDLKLEFDGEVDYLRIAQYYYNTFGQNQYLKKIEEVFSSKSTTSPNELHRLIENIAPKHIITTNYDNLLEEQFENGLLRYSIVAEDKDIPYSQAEKYLIKMHGDFSKKNMVLKEDDYLDYQLKFPMISTLVQSLIMNHTLLFVGYSLRDSTFNSIFRLIQSTFEVDAKKAYFYTPKAPSKIEVDYYAKKGIVILSNDFGEHSEENQKQYFYLQTKNFFEDIIKNNTNSVYNTEDLWNQLSFLDKLSFIDSRDFSRYSGMNQSLRSSFDSIDLVSNSKYDFEKSEHSKLKKLLEEKSLVNYFLDFELENEREIKINYYLKEAYNLYKEKRYSLAKAKFRELASESYRKKDYFIFLICEFNFLHIHSFSADDKDYPAPVYSESLKDLTQQMIDSLEGNDKKIIEYFRDEILNFKFLDRKSESINTLFDKVRQEHDNYKRGGTSYNNHLWNAEFEIKNLQTFLEKNCICVEQYRPYKSIINRYLEILLLSYDNSFSKLEEDDLFFNETSSVLKEIELEDLKVILPCIDLKMINMYFRNYLFGKIKITEEARDYLYNTINKLQSINRLDNIESYNEYKKILSFLSFIDFDDINPLIEILEKQELYFDLSKEIKNLVRLLLEHKNSLKRTEKERLLKVIERHINDIIANNLNLYHSNYRCYASLLAICDSGETPILISVDELDTDILRMKYQKKEISSIMEYNEFLIYFYKYLSNEVKNDLKLLFSKYEAIEDLNYNYVVKLMLSKVHRFTKRQKDVYQYLISNINSDNKEEFRIYPDPLETSLSNLFNLKNIGYFNKCDVTEDITKDIKGIFPEVDWVWFNDRSEEVILRLLQNRTLGDIKKYFAKNSKDKKLINDFIIHSLEEEKIDIKSILKH